MAETGAAPSRPAARELHRPTGRASLGFALALATMLLWAGLPLALQLVLRRLDAVTLTASERIDASDLPRLRQPVRVSGQDAADIDIPVDGFDLDRVVTDFERAIVIRALEQARGVRKRAAQLLGISFRSLRYRLAKLGLESGSDGEKN